MNNFEFISYEPTPDDKYIVGIATIRLYGKVILRYKKIKNKNHDGEFFCAASYAIDKNGEKKYFSTHMLDSRAEDEMLMEFIKENANAYMNKFNVNPIKNAIPIQQTPFIQRAEYQQEELPF